MERLAFTKMQGLGNDFVVLDGVTRRLALAPEQIRHLADRRLGVGCDQVLVVEPATAPDADFRYRIFNADGGEVEHCGNGVRCLARFLLERGLTERRELTLQTGEGRAVVRVCSDGPVTVDMGPPILDPARIPFQAPAEATSYALRVDGTMLEIAAVSMGNPHAVLAVEDVDRAPVAQLGPSIESHPDFPRRVNAGFMQVVDRGHIRLRVFERGVGETLACGTGACAAVVAGRLRGWLDDSVAVDLPGGRLVIHWSGRGEPVWMTGPAVTVFDGVISI
ncbi:diaminopimelate epimerase [Sediminicurvatus halobius]|uniref:Diaminopimelate epimerase n=1 Tax=Sediminicurvatus halobius TaxID=2182432 RepID=A0A2U2N2J4_9GAMM|nr:diaminopimelate epimerase [Spiribacter halobius]PWG63416.1 diaminopimelate epimerase [Spiribacter halobius]UEX78086.1 diaminopimelate epimerase [Spiribacter halobius]